MKFTVRYMLTKSERRPHRKKRILTQYGTLEVDLPADPMTDEDTGRILRQKLGSLVEGWTLGGYSVSEGEGASSKRFVRLIPVIV